MLAAAKTSTAEFPQLLQTLKDQFLTHDPLGIMASFAVYGLRTFVSERGIEELTGLGILQHHAELLQAIMLTIPANLWGRGVLVPPVMQTVFDTVPKLSDAFRFQRVLEAAEIAGEQETAIRFLQERLRLHTQGVRNWGYYGDVIRLSKELYGPLDPAFRAVFKFGPTDLIELFRAIVSEYERRQNAHWTNLRKIARGSNTHQIVRLYYKHVPDLLGTADELIAGLPLGIARDQIMGMVMAHFDLRLAETATFTLQQFGSLTALAPEVIDSIIRAVALKPGSLADAEPRHLFLSNPTWERPVIELRESFFIPLPQMALSHIHRIVERLGGEASLKTNISDRRAEFLERRIESTIKAALPTADVRPAFKWMVDSRQFETDLLVTIDRVVLIVEAKSHRLTPEGLRGAPDRVKRHIQEMVLEPSVQSARLESLILAARNGDRGSEHALRDLKIDLASIDRVVRISVTLDDLSALTTAEADFKKVGWVPVDHQLAPTMLISDLECIAEILVNPLTLLHYLSERFYFQKTFNVFGDELDLLGLYLTTFFNINAIEKTTLIPSGMSAPIDRYYESRDAGVIVRKPTAKLQPTFAKVIERLAEVQSPGWTTIGMHLLSAADPAEQKAVERSLEKLRAIVRRDQRNPGHLNTLQMQPPEERKAKVIFYLFSEAQRPVMKEYMERLASQALSEVNVKACVVFGRCIDNWQRPYEAALLAESGGG